MRGGTAGGRLVLYVEEDPNWNGGSPQLSALNSWKFVLHVFRPCQKKKSNKTCFLFHHRAVSRSNIKHFVENYF